MVKARAQMSQRSNDYRTIREFYLLHFTEMQSIGVPGSELHESHVGGLRQLCDDLHVWEESAGIYRINRIDS